MKKDIRVLIAEDDFLTRELVKGILQKIGYLVIGEAADGHEAIELTQSLGPDIVLMDLHMPKMNGLEATQKISEKDLAPVLILTANNDAGIAARVCDAGARACLFKPPVAEELQGAILAAISP